MTAQTTTQRTAAHRRRQAEKLARYEGALRNVIVMTKGDWSLLAEMVFAEAREALNPTTPAKSTETG